MRFACWKIMPILWRRVWSVTGVASIRMVPLSGVMRPAAAESRVDLPDPDSPTMKVISPSRAVKVALWRAVMVSWPSWKVTVTFSMVSI